jgi:hypothetical protein
MIAGLTRRCSGLAFATSEYRVPSAFITWLEDATNPPQVTSAEEGPSTSATVCYRMSLGVTNRWPLGASAVYMAAEGRLIVTHTAPFLGALGQLAAQWRRQQGKQPPNPTLLEVLQDQCPPRQTQ